MVAQSGKEADDNADRVHTYDVGYCQRFTRESWEVGSLYGSAIDAWNGAKYKHPGDRNPPEGAPTYYSGGNYGHAVVSAGGGRIRSTDCPSSGQVNDEALDWPERHWGYRYLGWTGDINGVTCPNLGDDDSSGGDEDMPKYDHASRGTDAPIETNVWRGWTWESVNGAGGFEEDEVGCKIGGRVYTAVLHVTVDAPEGSTIRMRTAEYANGQYVENNPQSEMIATSGTTYATHTQNGKVSEGRGLRFLITCSTPATLLSADATVLSW